MEGWCATAGVVGAEAGGCLGGHVACRLGPISAFTDSHVCWSREQAAPVFQAVHHEESTRHMQGNGDWSKSQPGSSETRGGMFVFDLVLHVRAIGNA